MLHDDSVGVSDAFSDALVWENLGAVDVDFVSNGDVHAEDGDLLEASPSTDGGLPADDGGVNP